MLNSKKIENFWGGSFIKSSPDLIAVKYGIKKVARMESNDLEAFRKTKKDLEKESLKVVCSDEKLLGKFNIYISKSEKLAIKAKGIDPSFKLINQNKEFTDVVDDIRLFSELLGYPSCCTDKYLENISDMLKVSSAKVFLELPKKINFLFNNILNGVSNHYLSFHFPCSFTCAKTLDYQKKIFNKMKQVSPEFSKEIEGYLKNVYLVFLDPSLEHVYLSWDNRKGFIFDGFLKKGSLSYSDTMYFQPYYPDYKNNKLERKFSSLVNKINKGDKIIFEKSGFKIYRGRMLSHKFKNTEKIQAILFNFV
tara:strand:+ start:1040 stop:1960 length:921 start_codon:yes stop_codon:yes gene_type:complete